MDSPHHIPNEILGLEHLPKSDDDDQMVWIEFALAFDGYAEMGSQRSCADFANEVREDWEKSGLLPQNLSQLRTALFFEQRRWRWSNEEPFTNEEWQYWRSLVDAIRRILSGDEQAGAVKPIQVSVGTTNDDAPKLSESVDDERAPKEMPSEKTVDPHIASPSKDRTCHLYSETDSYGGSRSVWLRLTREGQLILEGQDLGGAPVKLFGMREYEWAWSLLPQQISTLLEILCLGEIGSADRLQSIADALKKRKREEVESLFENAGAKFWNRIGD
jgi:hypothetical protein